MALYDHEGTRGLAPLSILGQHAMCHLYSSQILTFHPSTLHPTPPILPSPHPPIPPTPQHPNTPFTPSPLVAEGNGKTT